MKRLFIGGAVVVSALLIAGCGGSEEAAKGNASDTAAAEEAAGEEATNDAAPAEEGNATAEGGAQQDFTLVNNTGRTLMTLNVSASDQNEWGPDILGSATVPNGGSGQVAFVRGNEQCLWDLRATFDDGETGDWRGVNLCETATVTLTPTE